MSNLHQPSAFDIVPWNPSFETGIEVIDEQHRRLVELLNDLAHQYVYGLELAEVERIVGGLVDYAAYHFNTEEALWKEVLAGDQWFEAHQHTHNGFVQKVRKLQSELVQNENLPALDDLLSFLISWLAHHILYEDKRFSVVWLEVQGGRDLDAAKKLSLDAMSGQASGLIQSVLGMYQQLSTRTLALEREAYARQQAEQALRKQESYWQSVLGATNDSLWDWDAAQLESVRQSDQAVFGQRIHPDDWPGLRKQLLEHLLGETGVFSHQHRVIENDGRERWVQSRGKIIKQDSCGRPLRMVGTQTDITDRKTAEFTLKRDRDMRLLISEFAADFMASSPEDFDAAINRALQRGGEYLQSDRVYVVLVTDDGQYMNNTHEWCAHGISSELESLQEVPCDSVPWWWQELKVAGHVLVSRVSEMPRQAQTEQALLQAQSVQSVCVYPLRMGKKLVGFLGCDAVTRERHWGSETLEFLGLMSDLLGIALDHRQLHQKRVQALGRLERAEQQAHLGHWSFNLHSGEIIWSPEMFRIFGLNPEQQAPDYDAYFEMIHPDDRRPVHQAFKKAKDTLGKLHVEHRILLDEGRNRHVEIRGQFEPGRDGCPAIAEGTLQDITAKAQHREELRRQAFEDSLTGLPNRRALEDTLLQQIAHCSENKQRLVLGLLDLDNFREANEQYGPAIGDAVLVALSQRMRLLFDQSVVIARVGGDEFVVLFTGLDDDEDCFPQINRVLAAISEPLTIEGVELAITASVGVTEYPQIIKVSAEQLLRQAQQALFEAKLQGKGRFLKYNVAWEQDTRAMTGRLQEIERALHADEFVLYYQPKVHMSNGSVFG
ncbi:MAG: bacteriohemerythrin, partial [Marinobacter sp.]|nr:bacteriohemerythrin [Marinobacter sp.]